MIVILTGSTHTGKTALAQRLLETYHMPYLSIDHLKMGLIRSGQTSLTPMDDEALTPYLWSIVREMIRTALENHQNLIVEGCYVPFDWRKDFTEAELTEIRYCCLIMSREYILRHFDDILAYGNVIERRMEDGQLSQQALLEDNARNLQLCKAYHCPYWLIDQEYNVNLMLTKVARS